MKDKPKKVITCKAQNKALGFESCGKVMTEFEKRTYGLCNSCLWSFYHNDERGKILYHKLFLPKVAVKMKVNQKIAENKMKENVKTLSQYEAEAKKSFQKFIRLRDSGKPCKSCQNPNPSDWCGSHFFPAGIYSGMIFDERNCHGACNAYCNKYLSGNLNNYRINLVKEFGEDWVQQLENDALERRNYKWTKQELIDKKTYYDLKIKQLQK